jgi:hypothetical protein
VLPELNPTHGTTLQRVVNTLIKARDPVVFCKLGARTHDWGRELRVWGAESKIELQRDYVLIDLNDALMRNENTGRTTFSDLAADVAVKRLREEGGYSMEREGVAELFGVERPEDEAWSYFAKDKSKKVLACGDIPIAFVEELQKSCGPNVSPLELRLASAWVLQRVGRGHSSSRICREMRAKPWLSSSWKKERIQAALFQIASIARSKKRYCGWTTIVDLAGANIAAFLLLVSEVWDTAIKFGHVPIEAPSIPNRIPHEVQEDGIRAASYKWAQRDRLETTGGRRRYGILSRLGPAIHDAVVEDQALSNPGHTGFSLREIDIDKDPRVSEMLRSGVSWAILEERHHTSKNEGDTTRRKFYLHPLLSPTFDVPHKRVKEPLYISLQQAIEWFTTDNAIRFGGSKKERRRIAHGKQSELPFDGGEGSM